MANEDTLALVAERAKQNGDGKFTIQVKRRRQLVGTLQHHATFGDCCIAHLTSLESWLPRIFGGGQIFVAVHHEDVPLTRIGEHLEYVFSGEPFAAPNWAAIAQAGSNWSGPINIKFPDVTPGAQSNSPSHVSQQPGTSGLPGVTLTSGNQLPQSGNGGNPGVSPAENTLLQRERELIQREQNLMRDINTREISLMKQINDREASFERERFAQQMRADAEAAQRRLDMQLEEIKKTAANAAAQQTAKPALDIPALLTVVGPLFIELMKSNAQRADQAAAQQREFMQAMMAKPTGLSPEMALVIETFKSRGSGEAEMMSRVIDAMSTVSKSSVTMIEAIADMNLGGQGGNPVLDAVKEGVKAFAQLSKGAEAGGRKAVQNARPQQLPPNIMQYRPTGPVAAQMMPVQQMPQMQPIPAPVPQVIAQAPVVPAPNVPPAFDGISAASVAAMQAQQAQEPVGVLQQLEDMIHAHHEPKDDVVKFFFAALDTNEMKQALASAGGDYERLVNARLGAWVLVPENLAYLSELGELIEQVGEEMNVWAPEDDDTETEEEEAAVS